MACNSIPVKRQIIALYKSPGGVVSQVPEENPEVLQKLLIVLRASKRRDIAVDRVMLAEAAYENARRMRQYLLRHAV